MNRGPVTPSFNNTLEKAWKATSLTITDTILANDKVQTLIQYMRARPRYADFFANGTIHGDYQKYLLKVVYEKELASLERVRSCVPNTWDIFHVQVTNELRYLSPHQSPLEKTKTVMRAISKSEHFSARTPDEKNALKDYILATCYRDSIDGLLPGIHTNQRFVDAVVEAYRACFSVARAKL